ncbi:MAG TPA: hypothetical protein VHW01_06785, partial [Polyangiaceae bacterium]|nr:hypothetical protein [Polyangiaceae bacterium]
KNIRHLIDTAVAKLVLVLGRFSPERKAVLDRVRVELRAKGYVPVVFDFEGPSTRDTTETVSTLAHLARFVIADLSDPRCVQHELSQIVPYLPSVPVAPIIDAGQPPYAMVDHWASFAWVLKTYAYENADALIADLDSRIVGPAEAKWLEKHAPR